jgi:hypothetical protein
VLKSGIEPESRKAIRPISVLQKPKNKNPIG